jgi:hypothetical protein
MSINDAERADLGERIRTQRERLFGTKKAAYQAADVNSATWDKAEAGESVRGDLLRRIVRTLWPETEGDWTLVDQEIDPEDPSIIAELVDRVAALEDRLTELFKAQKAPPAPPATREDEKPVEGSASA